MCELLGCGLLGCGLPNPEQSHRGGGSAADILLSAASTTRALIDMVNAEFAIEVVVVACPEGQCRVCS